MKSLNLVEALALVTVLAAPAFADQRMPMPTAPTQGTQTVASGGQLLVPFPKKWWSED
jgi:hypothetical protein